MIPVQTTQMLSVCGQMKSILYTFDNLLEWKSESDHTRRGFMMYLLHVSSTVEVR